MSEPGPASSRRLVGTTVRDGRYAISGVLGEGSQGATLEAVDKLDGRLVAIKRFQVRGARSWKDVELAEREARVLSRLSHRLLPKPIERFEEDGALYLVMEKIEGDSLASVSSLNRDEVIRFLTDADEVLGYLHSQAPPVIHRDIKPGNVIRRPPPPDQPGARASYVLVDFGSVRDSLKPAGGSTVVGTFGYMAPEQFQGRALPASDVYAVGTTALRLLTGVEPEDLPHQGLAIDVRKALGRRDPAMVDVLEAMLKPNPDERASRIGPLLVRLPTSATPPPDGGDRAAARAPGPPPPVDERAAPRRHQRRERRRQRGRRRRAGARKGWPPLAIAFAVLGLAVARLAVWLALQVLVPVLLTLVGILIPAVRPAAKKVRAAGRAADDGLARARNRVLGRVVVPDDPEPRGQRIETPGPRVEPDEQRSKARVESNPVEEAIGEMEAAIEEVVEEVQSELKKHTRR